MSDSCCAPPTPSADPRYRKILWIALALNVTMFAVEIAGSMRSGSVSLLADAIDFLGDAANYGISLAVLGLAIAWRARASLLKAACMAGFGTFVLGRAIWSFLQGGVPEPLTMGVIALLALCVNVGVALMLYRYRTGDSNMRSVWICSRNDAIGNIAVAAAALGVLGTGQAWPDLLVATGMALLALSGAWTVTRHALQELRSGPVLRGEPYAS
ncbi:MAG: cation transporter [Pseudomonadota bacterium]|nr:cation transporter [Pseudomonadota bacterium]